MLKRLCVAVSLSWAVSGCGQASEPDEPDGDEQEPGGKRPPCTQGADQSCNADPAVSSLWGRCTELGVCECNDGFELNPLGLCQPPQ